MEMLAKNIVMSGCGCEREGGAAEEEIKSSVDCALNNEMLNAIGLARAYVPVQPYSQPMEEMASLACGSVFGPLIMPYVKGSAILRYAKEECDDGKR